MDRRAAIQRALTLSGAAITLPLVSSVLQGCKSDSGKAWAPAFFSEEQAGWVESIVDIILPSSDQIPGSNEVGVPQFMEKILADCYPNETQSSFIKGLEAFVSEFETQLGVSINDSDADDLREYLLAKDTAAYAGGTNNASFYRSFKQLAILGYLTSEEIMTTQLNYHAIPQVYQGCIPYDGKGAYVDNNVVS